MKRTPPKRTPLKKAAKRPAKPRRTKKDMWADYGLVRPAKPRFSGLRGIAWHVLSLYVRERDLKAFGQVCVNCGNEKTDFHGGHFIPAGKCGWDGLSLDELNIHAECSYCNFRDKTKLNYARNLDLRYGPGTAQKLRDRYYEYASSKDSYKNYTQDEYRQFISKYKALLQTLSGE